MGSFSWLIPSAGGAGSELGALWSGMLGSVMLLEELAVSVAAVQGTSAGGVDCH